MFHTPFWGNALVLSCDGPGCETTMGVAQGATSEGHGFASLFLSIQLRTYISLHSISREGVASVPFHFHSKSIVALWSSSLIWRGLPVGTLTLSQPFPLISILLAPENHQNQSYFPG